MRILKISIKFCCPLLTTTVSGSPVLRDGKLTERDVCGANLR